MILEKKYLQPLPDINVKYEIYFVVHKVFYMISYKRVFLNHTELHDVLSILNMNIIVLKNEQVDFEVS